MAGWQFWIDRGGTFTDIVASRPRLPGEIPRRIPTATRTLGLRRHDCRVHQRRHFL